MSLYDKVLNILEKKLIPEDVVNRLNANSTMINHARQKINKQTAPYYVERIEELYIERNVILEDMSCYNFYENTKCIDSESIYDLHGIYGNQVDSFLDAIFDYNISINNNCFRIITGNGNVLKQKAIKYLKSFNVIFKVENNGTLKIQSF